MPLYLYDEKDGNKQLRIPSLPLHVQGKFRPNQLQNQPKHDPIKISEVDRIDQNLNFMMSN